MKLFLLSVLFLFVTLVGNAQIINIPDAALKSILLNHSPHNIDSNNDGEIQVTEAEATPYLSIRHPNSGINFPQVYSLQGISAFVNITNISFSEGYVDMATIEISDFQNLNSIDIEDESVVELIVNNIPNLNKIDLDGVLSFTTLNTDNCQCDLNIEEIKVEGPMPQFTSLDFSEYINLKKVNLRNTSFTELDLTNNTGLEWLRIDDLVDGFNYPLDFSNNLNLSYLDLSYLENVDLDFSNHENIEYFTISNIITPIIDLSKSPNLISLRLVSSEIDFVNIKNGTIVTGIFSLYDGDFDYICADDNELDAVLAENANINAVSSYCSFTPGGDYYVIEGENKVDANLDSCDANDYLYPNLKFNITDGMNTGTYISDASGNYNMPVSEGIHTITPILNNPDYFSISPTSLIVDFPTDVSPNNQDFCVTPNGVHNDLEIVVVPLEQAIPGFDSEYKLIYKNKGNTLLSGLIEFDYSSNSDVVQFLSATPTNDSETNSILLWNYTDLAPFETREVLVTFNLNTPTDVDFPLNSGDELAYIANISPLNDDETPGDNSFELEQTVVNSFDPNDIRCLEGETILPEDVGKYVHYLIRFENLGTANAINIVVKNTIDATKFDINTMVPLDGSHDYFTRINPDNDVEFIFENIQLPFDDASNDGYVVYKIKTLQSLVLGDEFSNQAEIYFDFNAPIITNIYSTEVAEDNLGTSDFSLPNLRVYPNPVNNILIIESNFTINAISVFDIEGRKVLEILEDNSNQINMSTLETGIYFVKVFSDSKTETLKVIKH